jgi:hypothetical protein
MVRTVLAALLLATVVAEHAAAQQASPPRRTEDGQTAEFPAGISMTPEMWFYLEEVRRYEDPSMAVRRNAEIRAQQRQNRLAALKWFGFSNLRPQASPTPMSSSYSPAWVGSVGSPYSWTGLGNHSYVVRSGDGGSYAP